MAGKKRGRCARRARQGQLGIVTTMMKRTKKGTQFKKRDDRRVEKKQKKMDQEHASELVREQLGRGKKDAEKTPFSFVIHSGSVGKYVRRLERDVRRILMPNTSKDLRVMKRNSFKDFFVHAQYLGVSHLLVFSRTEQSLNLRIIRTPQGPTVQFRVESYSLIRDVQSSQRRPVNIKDMFLNAPLVILNGFAQKKQRHLSLVQNLLQHMFPTIDVDKVRLKAIHRALLASYDAEKDVIEIRHYAIRALPSGMSKSTRKLMRNKVPDLSKYNDVSDFLLNSTTVEQYYLAQNGLKFSPGVISESEQELDPVDLELPQDMNTRGLMKGQTTRIRLTEIGPRMTWRITKITEGINKGDVLYKVKTQEKE